MGEVSGWLVLLYGWFCYLAFLASFVFLVGFVGDLGTPRSLSVGPTAPTATALMVDLGLLALFSLQHSFMARPGFKRFWTRLVAPSVERSTYVLASALALGLLFFGWRTLPQAVWHSRHPYLRLGIRILFWGGVAQVLISTFLVNHGDLFGLRQVLCRFRNQPYRERPFRLGGFYARVRHPLMLGFLVLVWAAPTMTLGHLLFALGMTAYIWVGTRLEERDLARRLGPAYQDYLRSVPRFFPVPGRRYPKAPAPPEG